MSPEHSVGRLPLLPFILALGHLCRHSLQSVFGPVTGISRVRLTGLWCLLVWSNASLDVAEKVCLRWSKGAYLLSCVRPFAPLGTVARQAPLSMGFSKQEHWSGLPCPPPPGLFPTQGSDPGLLHCKQILSGLSYQKTFLNEKESESCSVVSNSLSPMDCGLPGSSVHGILQARILEWVAVPFSRGSSQSRD